MATKATLRHHPLGTVWVAAEGTGKAFAVRGAELRNDGTFTVTAVASAGHELPLETLASGLTGYSFHETEVEAKAAAEA